MLSSYVVLDVRPHARGTSASYVVEAHSPEDAATRALGLDLMRNGHPAHLQVKVYIQFDDRPQVLVRLYAKPDPAQP